MSTVAGVSVYHSMTWISALC